MKNEGNKLKRKKQKKKFIKSKPFLTKIAQKSKYLILRTIYLR